MEVPSVDIPTAQQEVVAQQDVVSPEECIHHAVVEIQNQAEYAEAVTDITNLTTIPVGRSPSTDVSSAAPYSSSFGSSS